MNQARTKTTRPPHNKTPGTSRRWFRLGPGLLLALTAIAWLWPHLFPPSASPVVERTLIERTRLDAVPATPSGAPDPAWLLSQRQGLKLNEAQFQKLIRLRARWERDTRGLRESLDHATREFNRAMAEDAKGSRGITVERLQERAGPVSELSRQLAQARRAWWDEASRVLDAAQRRRAQEAWSRHLARRFKPVGTPSSSLGD